MTTPSDSDSVVIDSSGWLEYITGDEKAELFASYFQGDAPILVPVIVLSDGYLANGAEPWLVPEIDELPAIEVKFAEDPATFLPYARDPVDIEAFAAAAHLVDAFAGRAAGSRLRIEESFPIIMAGLRKKQLQSIKLRIAESNPSRVRNILEVISS